MLFLNFFADAQPKYVDLEGILIVFLVVRWAIKGKTSKRMSHDHHFFLTVQADDLTPEVFASFPSKMTFSW